MREVISALLRPGALKIVFQPIVDLRPRRTLLHGVECLARGPIETAKLFELVRRLGAEIPVDRACISEALRAASALPRMPSFSINVHARTLADDREFADFFIESLCLWGIDPKRITLDLLQPQDLAPALIETAEVLRAVGISIAVDDIGAGDIDYEGLLACRPEYLKIDRAWLKAGPPDSVREQMVEAIVRLARRLGAQPVAEGIETLDELDAASAHGIQLIQGHFFAEPMSAQELIGTELIGERALCG